MHTHMCAGVYRQTYERTGFVFIKFFFHFDIPEEAFIICVGLLITFLFIFFRFSLAAWDRGNICICEMVVVYIYIICL